MLEKNRKLDDPSLLTSSPLPPQEDDENIVDLEDKKSDLYDDIILLNEEVELLDSNVCRVRNHLKKLGEVLRHGQKEDVGETDEYRNAAELAVALVTQFAKYKSLEGKLNKLVQSIGELQKSANTNATPVSYMLQLPPVQVRIPPLPIHLFCMCMYIYIYILVSVCNLTSFSSQYFSFLF